MGVGGLPPPWRHGLPSAHRKFWEAPGQERLKLSGHPPLGRWWLEKEKGTGKADGGHSTGLEPWDPAARRVLLAGSPWAWHLHVLHASLTAPSRDGGGGVWAEGGWRAGWGGLALRGRKHQAEGAGLQYVGASMGAGVWGCVSSPTCV